MEEREMRIIISSILAIFCFSQIALAGTTYVCTSGDMERKIEVVYLGAGTVPCEVRYTKNGNTEVLWSAQAEGGYCEAKAAEFVEKQRGWGWECVESTEGVSEPASSEVPEVSEMGEGQPIE
jgi:hypothetical protein